MVIFRMCGCGFEGVLTKDDEYDIIGNACMRNLLMKRGNYS